jgi:hypothetical protein
MFSHPLNGRRYYDIDCAQNLGVYEVKPKTTLKILVCLLGWPFWLITNFVKKYKAENILPKSHRSRFLIED